MDHEEYKKLLETEIVQLQDRVATLEIVNKYHEKKPKKPDVLKFLDDNADIIAGVAIFVAINILLWEKLSYAN